MIIIAFHAPDVKCPAIGFNHRHTSKNQTQASDPRIYGVGRLVYDVW